MTTEHYDPWAALPEWEHDHDPGQILDLWREAAVFFAPLSKLVESSGNEALETAVYSAENRVREQVERWEAVVWTHIDTNRAEGRLTPFGEVLAPLLERAGLTEQALLVQAGRIEEPNAEEILLRRMYGPPIALTSGALEGWREPLELTDMEAVALSNVLCADLLRAVDPLSQASSSLTRAIEHLETVPAERFADSEDAYRATGLIAQAGGIVASAEQNA